MTTLLSLAVTLILAATPARADDGHSSHGGSCSHPDEDRDHDDRSDDDRYDDDHHGGGSSHAQPGYGQAGDPSAVYASTSARLRELLADDRSDLGRIDHILRDWELARIRHDRARERLADRELFRWIESERFEARNDLARAREAVADAARVLAREEQDLRRHGYIPGYEYAEAEAAARNLSDERADLAKVEAQLARHEATFAQIEQLQYRFDRGQAGWSEVERKRAALDELRRLSEREIRFAEAEIDELRQELQSGFFFV